MRFSRLIILALILGLFLCWTSGNKKETKEKEVRQEEIAIPEKIIPEPAPAPKPQPKPIRNPNSRCTSYSTDVMDIIQTAAKELSGTVYSQSKKTDCSGMFHKVLDRIRIACPSAKMPKIHEARASRDIAVWYNKYGKLTIIRNPETQSELIKPGAVMFFGYGGMNEKYDRQSLNISQLSQRGTGVNHVAIVTKVDKRNGEVIHYEMFHGRNPRHPAGITSSMKIYPYKQSLPPFGNANEPWLAVANLVAE